MLTRTSSFSSVNGPESITRVSNQSDKFSNAHFLLFYLCDAEERKSTYYLYSALKGYISGINLTYTPQHKINRNDHQLIHNNIRDSDFILPAQHYTR